MGRMAEGQSVQETAREQTPISVNTNRDATRWEYHVLSEGHTHTRYGTMFYPRATLVWQVRNPCDRGTQENYLDPPITGVGVNNQPIEHVVKLHRAAKTRQQNYDGKTLCKLGETPAQINEVLALHDHRLISYEQTGQRYKDTEKIQWTSRTTDTQPRTYNSPALCKNIYICPRQQLAAPTENICRKSTPNCHNKYHSEENATAASEAENSSFFERKLSDQKNHRKPNFRRGDLADDMNGYPTSGRGWKGAPIHPQHRRKLP